MVALLRCSESAGVNEPRRRRGREQEAADMVALLRCSESAGVNEPRRRRGREREAADMVALLLEHGVTDDRAAAEALATGKIMTRLRASTVQRNLEALSFCGWDVRGASASRLRDATPSKVVARTAFLKAHECAPAGAAVACC